MKIVKKIGLWLLAIAAILYLGICALMYFNQEKLIFHPTKLPADFKFEYKQAFTELSIEEEDGVKLNGLLFKADSSKGLIFYLHGNAGALNTWGKAAKNYTKLGYDIFILDYRGFGKSEGNISSEKQFFTDVQQAYNELKKKYPENKIIILGYSIGTGPAAMLASTNHPKLLILQAPYYSLIDMMQHTYSFVPEFLLKYKFQTNEFVKNTKSPVYIFHGDADEVIYYGSSIKLKENFKPGDKLFTLPGKGHNRMNDDTTYLSELSRILSAN
jgi:uncharacterized protein